MSGRPLSFQLKLIGRSRRTMASPLVNGWMLRFQRRLEPPHCKRSPAKLKQTEAAEASSGMDSMRARPLTSNWRAGESMPTPRKPFVLKTSPPLIDNTIVPTVFTPEPTSSLPGIMTLGALALLPSKMLVDCVAIAPFPMAMASEAEACASNPIAMEAAPEADAPWPTAVEKQLALAPEPTATAPPTPHPDVSMVAFAPMAVRSVLWGTPFGTPAPAPIKVFLMPLLYKPAW